MSPRDNGWTRMDPDGPRWTRMNPWWIFFYLISRRFSVKWTLLRKKIFFGWNFFFEKNSKFSSKFLGIFFSEEFLQKCSVHARWCTEGGYAAINILTVQSIKLKHILSTNWFFGLTWFFGFFGGGFRLIISLFGYRLVRNYEKIGIFEQNDGLFLFGHLIMVWILLGGSLPKNVTFELWFCWVYKPCVIAT